jgi:hypothetical protein
MPLLGRHRTQRNWGARLREYTQDGLSLVVLENEALRISVLAGKGADLVEWLVKPLDLDLAWLAPGGIANPAHLPASIPDGRAAFMDAYPGGWQTVFPHGSIPADVHGAPYGLHGEAALLPWDAAVLEDSPQAVEVAFLVRLRRMPFTIERRIRLEAGAAAFTMQETVRNDADQPLDVNWGQHITFGPPFLEAGCRIVMPEGIHMHQHPLADGESRRARIEGAVAWPTAPAPEAAADQTGSSGPAVNADLSLIPAPGSPSEMAYLSGFAEDAWFAVDNPRLGVTAGIGWNGDRFPWCWCWQEFGATRDWPWFGRAFVIGLEPFAGPPPNAHLGDAPGREPLRIGPGEQLSVSFRAVVTKR